MRALIFDLDGTLADTVDDIHASLVAAGVGATREAVLGAVGGGVAKLVERLVADASKREGVQARFREHYAAHLLDRTKLFPGARETLEALSPRPMAVLSNKPEGMSKRIVEGLGIARHFRAVYGGDSMPVRKPDPAVMRRVLEELGVAAGDALLVGDSRYDIETGRNAGVAVCAVTWGYAARSELEGADYVIDAFAELLRLAA